MIEEAIVEGAREIGHVDLESGVLEEARSSAWGRERERRDGVRGEVEQTEEREGEKDGDGERERSSLHCSWKRERENEHAFFLGIDILMVFLKPAQFNQL